MSRFILFLAATRVWIAENRGSSVYLEYFKKKSRDTKHREQSDEYSRSHDIRGSAFNPNTKFQFSRRRSSEIKMLEALQAYQITEA